MNRNGPEWHRMRMSLQRPINMTENIRRYVKEVDEVAGEFAEKVANSARLEKHSTNFLDDLSRVFLECNYIIRQVILFPILSFYI